MNSRKKERETVVQEKWVVSRERLQVILQRMAWEIIARWYPFRHTCMVGLLPNGVELARRLHAHIEAFVPEAVLPLGIYEGSGQKLRQESAGWKPLSRYQQILIVDDVLYTGRNVVRFLEELTRQKISARKDVIVLVDRRGNRHYPVEPAVRGVVIDAVAREWIRVWWTPRDPVEGISIRLDQERSPS